MKMKMNMNSEKQPASNYFTFEACACYTQSLFCTVFLKWLHFRSLEKWPCKNVHANMDWISSTWTLFIEFHHEFAIVFRFPFLFIDLHTHTVRLFDCKRICFSDNCQNNTQNNTMKRKNDGIFIINFLVHSNWIVYFSARIENWFYLFYFLAPITNYIPSSVCVCVYVCVDIQKTWPHFGRQGVCNVSGPIPLGFNVLVNFFKCLLSWHKLNLWYESNAIIFFKKVLLQRRWCFLNMYRHYH